MIKITKTKALFGTMVLVFASVGTALTFRTQKVEATIPYTTARVSLTNGGGEGDNISDYSSVSKEGRYVAFKSSATNLVSGDTNNREDIFVRDTISNTTVRASVSSGGTEANNGSSRPSISSDGRYVAFMTDATNLVANDTNGATDIVLRDLQAGTTELVSISTGGTTASGWSDWPKVSRDGRYIVFSSIATNLVASDTNAKEDVFLRDRKLSTTTRLSVASGGTQANDVSRQPVISCDGAFVAFESSATNLTPNDTNGARDIFIVNRVGGDTITNVTQSGNGNSQWASLACNGESVGFESAATNLVAGDSNGYADIFVYDVYPETIERVSVSSVGVQANNLSQLPSLSADGRCIAFDSAASNLVSNDGAGVIDIFLRNRDSNTTERISIVTSSQQTNAASERASITADGKKVIYSSDATNLVSGDINNSTDIFASETGVNDCSI